jgi:O-antigen/teichoic acid export membrane protein
MSLFRNSTYTLISAIAPLVIGIITVPIYLQTIGIANYGIMIIIYSVLGYFGFLDLGLGNALTQKIAQAGLGRIKKKEHILTVAMTITTLMSIFGCLVIWLASYHINYISYISNENKIIIKDSSLYLIIFIPILLLTSVYQGVLKGESKFIELSVIQLFNNISIQVVPLIVALYGYKEIIDLLLAVFACKLITLFLLSKQSNKLIKTTFNFKAIFGKRHGLLSYGGYSSMISISAQSLSIFDRFIILSLCGEKAVTYYSIPTDFFSKILIIPNSLTTPLFTIAAENKTNKIKYYVNEITLKLVKIMTPFIILLVLFGNDIIMLWVGEEIAINSRLVSVFCIFGLFFLIIALPKHTEIMAINGPKVIFKCYLIELPCYVIALYYMITNFGIAGAAFTWMMRVFLDAILILHISNSLKNILLLTYK